jgi:hypothetical protein
MAMPPEPESADARQVPDATPHLAVSELLGEHQGASSPFGDLNFPLSVQELETLGDESKAVVPADPGVSNRL